jgi:hypothetical protein
MNSRGLRNETHGQGSAHAVSRLNPGWGSTMGNWRVEPWTAPGEAAGRASNERRLSKLLKAARSTGNIF